MPVNLSRWLLRPNLLLAAGALSAGVLAAWFGSNHLRERASSVEQAVRQRYATDSYVVAAQDIVRGQRIDSSALALRSMPRSFVPLDALRSDGAGELMGARAAIDMRRGTPVVAAALSREPVRTRLSGELPAGMRAMTIQVDQLNALGGHLTAGDTVDVFYSRPEGSAASLVPLQQRVHVLATGSATESGALPDSERDGADFSSVTLLLSAEDATRMVLAEQTGKLTLLLRKPADAEEIPMGVRSSRELMRAARTHMISDPDRIPIELLVGGNGGSAPVRSWLAPGRPGEGA